MNSWRTFATHPRLLARAGVSLAGIAVFVGGSQIAGPFTDTQAVDTCQAELGGYFSLVSTLAGGGLPRLSVFSLGVVPFISAALILLVAGWVVPAARQLSSRGRVAFIAVIGGVLAAVQAFTISRSAAQAGGLLVGCDQALISASDIAAVTTSLILGSFALLGLSQLMTMWGVGSGLSLLIAAGIAAGIPTEALRVGSVQGVLPLVGAAAAITALVWGIVRLRSATVSLPMVSTRGDQRSQYTVPFALSSIMPVVFANILVMGVGALMRIIPTGVTQTLGSYLGSVTWVSLLALAVTCVFFVFFQVIRDYSADDVAKEYASAGLYAVNPANGEADTDDTQVSARRVDSFYLRVTIRSAAVLTALACLPSLALLGLGLRTSLPLGGAALLILVFVALDTLRHAQALAAEATGQPLPGGASSAKDLQTSFFTAPAVPIRRLGGTVSSDPTKEK